MEKSSYQIDHFSFKKILEKFEILKKLYESTTNVILALRAMF